jgi:hypothetical protein
MNWKEFFSITIAGAVGGLLGWLISQTSSGLDGDWYLTLPTWILGGFVAAGVGVYVIASTDTSKMMRAIFFAALCGISWQPVLETGKSIVNKATTDKTVSTAKDEITKKVAQTTDQTATSQDIQALTNNTIKIAEKLPSVTDPGLKDDARLTAINGIKHFKFLAQKRPDEAVNSLEEIGKRAAASGSVNLKSEVIQELSAISHDPLNIPAQVKAANALEALK